MDLLAASDVLLVNERPRSERDESTEQAYIIPSGRSPHRRGN